MSDIDAAKATVMDLVRNFADACRGLVPNLDRAHVRWSDNQQYDNWDRVAEALFETLVLEPCRFQAEAAGLAAPTSTRPYAFGQNGENAFIRLKASSGVDCRFVQLLSVKEPFDHCEGSLGGEKLVLPVDSADLSFVVLKADGSHQEIEIVNLAL